MVTGASDGVTSLQEDSDGAIVAGVVLKRRRFAPKSDRTARLLLPLLLRQETSLFSAPSDSARHVHQDSAGEDSRCFQTLSEI